MPTKKIGGKIYKQVTPTYSTKKEANARAKKLRARYKGGSFRVFKLRKKNAMGTPLTRYWIFGRRTK